MAARALSQGQMQLTRRPRKQLSEVLMAYSYDWKAQMMVLEDYKHQKQALEPNQRQW